MGRGEPEQRTIKIGRDLSIAVVSTAWNDDVVSLMLRGAENALEQAGVSVERIVEFVVPGAFEIPLVLQRLAQSGRFDGLVALGAVIRGETPHFDFVAGVASDGIARVALDHDIPCGFGLLTVDNIDPAMERADPTRLDKGGEAARTVLSVIALLDDIDRPDEGT